MKKSFLHIYLTTASLFLALFSYSQSSELESIDSLLKIRATGQAFAELKKIDSAGLSKPFKAEYYYLLASAENLNNRADRSFKYWMIARKLFREIDSFGKIAKINLRIVQTLNSSKYEELDSDPFMNEYLQYAREQNDPHILALAHDQLAKVLIANDSLESLRQFKLALEQSEKTSDSLLTAKIHHNTGVVYGERLKKFDSAFYHYDRAFQEYEELGQKDFMSYIYSNRASIYKQQENYEAAIENYLKADSISPKEYSKENYRLRYGWLADAYELNNDPANALKYLKLQNRYRDSLMNEEQHTSMLDIQTKYEVEKKENENLKLKQRSTWLFTAIGSLLLTLIIGYLAYKNLQRKKKLAEKEHEVQRQKLENLLQEQELAGIDAMIEGQEKERKRIANDLHDNLGSLLATIKLHFQNLKIKKDRLKEDAEKIIKQTDDLLDEAYQEVRKIAHAKNAGVHASEGLLPAVCNFATKVSASNKLVIEVKDHGMDERLENSFEITVFRMVQELITNVIKHAKASEVIIHLTHRGEEIELMVEDNGRGFNSSEVKYEEGMGVHSIQRRVEYLGGTVDIKSVEGKGTSVFINIPIK